MSSKKDGCYGSPQLTPRENSDHTLDLKRPQRKRHARNHRRDEVRRLITEEDAQLVDVLPKGEYEQEHLAGALNLPLKQLNSASAAWLDRRRPVITYCHDYL